MYYSYAALTGDDSLLEHVRDCELMRFEIRVFGRGYVIRTVYVNGRDLCDRQFWEDFMAQWSHIRGYFRFLLAVPSVHYPGVVHCVAMVMDPVIDHVEISDPEEEEVQVMDIDRFLVSPYSLCYEVGHLQSADLDKYPPIWGDEQPHAIAAIAERGDS